MSQMVGTKPLRVVVVDDHEDLRLLVSLVLEHDPRFELVGEGASGEDAIDLVQHNQPDLMLLDLAMPGMDGLEVLEVAQQQWPGVPVIVVLSGFTASSMREAVIARGAAGYLEKGAAFGANVADDLFNAWSDHLSAG